MLLRSSFPAAPAAHTAWDVASSSYLITSAIAYREQTAQCLPSPGDGENLSPPQSHICFPQSALNHIGSCAALRVGGDLPSILRLVMSRQVFYVWQMMQNSGWHHGLPSCHRERSSSRLCLDGDSVWISPSKSKWWAEAMFICFLFFVSILLCVFGKQKNILERLVRPTSWQFLPHDCKAVWSWLDLHTWFKKWINPTIQPGIMPNRVNNLPIDRDTVHSLWF